MRMEGAKITEVKAVAFSASLGEPVRYGNIERVRSASALVRITGSNGQVGVGEACAVPQLTGESAELVVALVELYVRKLLLDVSVLEWRRATLGLRRRFPRSFVALAAIETALVDLVGKTMGISAHHLVGAKYRDRVELCGSVSWNQDVAAMAEDAPKKSLEYAVLKTYVGPADLASDMHRLEQLRSSVPDRTRIMLDMKGLWNRQQALSIRAALADMGVFLIEQPVPVDDYRAWTRPGPVLGATFNEFALEVHSSRNTKPLRLARFAEEKVPIPATTI